MLHDFIARNRDEIISRCRAKVATRSVPPPTAVAIDHGVPVFLDQLNDALRLGDSDSSHISGTAVQHGHDLLFQGFTVSQVVHDYGDVCQAITETGGGAERLDQHGGLSHAVEDDPVILADRQVLAAVLGNLLQNAFKFTHAGTTVTPSCGC